MSRGCLDGCFPELGNSWNLKPEIPWKYWTVYLYKWWVGRQRTWSGLLLESGMLPKPCESLWILDDFGKWEISSNLVFLWMSFRKDSRYKWSGALSKLWVFWVWKFGISQTLNVVVNQKLSPARHPKIPRHFAEMSTLSELGCAAIHLQHQIGALGPSGHLGGFMKRVPWGWKWLKNATKNWIHR